MKQLDFINELHKENEFMRWWLNLSHTSYESRDDLVFVLKIAFEDLIEMVHDEHDDDSVDSFRTGLIDFCENNGEYQEWAHPKRPSAYEEHLNDMEQEYMDRMRGYDE